MKIQNQSKMSQAFASLRQVEQAFIARIVQDLRYYRKYYGLCGQPSFVLTIAYKNGQIWSEDGEAYLQAKVKTKHEIFCEDLNTEAALSLKAKALVQDTLSALSSSEMIPFFMEKIKE